MSLGDGPAQPNDLYGYVPRLPPAEQSLSRLLAGFLRRAYLENCPVSRWFVVVFFTAKRKHSTMPRSADRKTQCRSPAYTCPFASVSPGESAATAAAAARAFIASPQYPHEPPCQHLVFPYATWPFRIVCSQTGRCSWRECGCWPLRASLTPRHVVWLAPRRLLRGFWRQ